MLGDNHKQEQKQDVKVENTVHGQDSKIEVPCDHYTNSFVELLEKKLKFVLNLSSAFPPDGPIINCELKKACLRSVLQHQGQVTKVFCSLLSDGTCKSPKNSGKRCYLLGPAPASASAEGKRAEY